MTSFRTAQGRRAEPGGGQCADESGAGGGPVQDSWLPVHLVGVALMVPGRQGAVGDQPVEQHFGLLGGVPAQTGNDGHVGCGAGRGGVDG
ncbi:hypothetical protein AB0H07_44910 [Streptomyces sp. NPDC021354]|uniref:hypothetical protein n=1 Tax=Streptomyces sp. NPDC021354 TaxID=3154793 RepID=UPI0034005A07